MSEARPLEGKIAVVTGASRGLGYAAALEIARSGGHVIAIARTVGGLEELDDAISAEGGTATLVPLDLTDFDGIDRLGASIHERWGRLDILLGNAGMLGPVTPLHQLKPDLFEQVFAVNVTANYRLIRSLDPLLRVSEAGRALFVTSGAVRSQRPYVGHYSASKAALEVMIASYAKEIQQTAIRVNLFDPATVRTRMRARYAPGENPQDVTPPEALAPKIVELLSPSVTQNGGIYAYGLGDWLA